MDTNSTKSFFPEDRYQARQLALDASEPITLFWSMRSMIAQNPRHDLECLLFDQVFENNFLSF